MSLRRHLLDSRGVDLPIAYNSTFIVRSFLKPLFFNGLKNDSPSRTTRKQKPLESNKSDAHKSVNHGRGEYARDEDGDGFCEVHVNTMEGFWSLLRSWLRPHRGISQEKLPLYLGFFEFVHNVRKRGKALLPALIELLVT